MRLPGGSATCLGVFERSIPMTRVRTVLTAMFLILVLAFSVVPLSAQYKEMYRLDNQVKDLPEQDAINTLATHLGMPADTLKRRSEERRVGKECRSRWSQ